MRKCFKIGLARTWWHFFHS